MTLFKKPYQIANKFSHSLIFHSYKVKSFKECVELAVKEKVDLLGANCSEVDLSGANLEGAKLGCATFRGSNLEGVNFKGADLEVANFDEAKMDGADFTNAKFSSDEIKKDCIRRSKESADKKAAKDAEMIKNAQNLIRAAMQKGK